jgi:hypothetical protein
MEVAGRKKAVSNGLKAIQSSNVTECRTDWITASAKGHGGLSGLRPQSAGRIAMARNLREVIATVQAERRAKIAAAYKQKLIAKKKKRQLEEAKRVMELERNLIVIAVLIIALPIIAALAAMLTVLAVGDH